MTGFVVQGHKYIKYQDCEKSKNIEKAQVCFDRKASALIININLSSPVTLVVIFSLFKDQPPFRVQFISWFCVWTSLFFMNAMKSVTATCHTGLPDLSGWRSMQRSVCVPRVDSVAAGTSGEHLPNIGCESASSLSVSRAKNSRCRNASALQQIDSYCIHRMRKCVYIRRRCPELVNVTAAHFRQKEQDALTCLCEFACDDVLEWTIVHINAAIIEFHLKPLLMLVNVKCNSQRSKIYSHCSLFFPLKQDFL